MNEETKSTKLELIAPVPNPQWQIAGPERGVIDVSFHGERPGFRRPYFPTLLIETELRNPSSGKNWTVQTPAFRSEGETVYKLDDRNVRAAVTDTGATLRNVWANGSKGTRFIIDAVGRMNDDYDLLLRITDSVTDDRLIQWYTSRMTENVNYWTNRTNEAQEQLRIADGKRIRRAATLGRIIGANRDAKRVKELFEASGINE